MEYVPTFTLKMAQMLVNVPAPWSRRVYLKLRFVSGVWKPTFNWRAPHCTFPSRYYDTTFHGCSGLSNQLVEQIKTMVDNQWMKTILMPVLNLKKQPSKFWLNYICEPENN